MAIIGCWWTLPDRASNRDGIGAEVRVVTDDGVERHAMVSTAGSYPSSND